MVTLDFIAALQARDISFTNFRNALKNHNLPASTGWDPTVEKLKPGLTGQDKEKYAVAIESIHNELTSFGDKCLKVFEIDSVYLKALIESMAKDFVCDSDLSGHYPYPMPRDELQEYNGGATCVAYMQIGNQHDFILCSKIRVTEREEMPGTALGDEAVQDFGAFDELIGIRRRPVQLFDVISIDPVAGYLDIRLDGLKKISVEDLKLRVTAIERIINEFAKKTLGVDRLLANPINFYPAIERLYEAPDGTIGELGHVTDAAGIYKEKMRRKDLDVRKDPYHHGGTEAVKNLNPFSISKRWISKQGYGYPEVAIPAHFSVASSEDPVIDMIYIFGCTCIEDYNFVMMKVL